jgi:hypothetical protein
VAQRVHPLFALATLMYAWSWLGSVLLPTHATYRFRAESMEVTTKFAAAPESSATPEATVIRSLASFGGVSRNVRFPAASGVPMLSLILGPSYVAWNTLPVTWSIAGYPSAPNGA